MPSTPTRAAAVLLALALGSTLTACGTNGDSAPVSQAPRDAVAEAGYANTLAAQAPAADVAAAAAPEAAAPEAVAAAGANAKAAKSTRIAAGAGKNKSSAGNKLSVPEAALDGRVIAYTAEQTIQVLDVGKAVTQIEAAVDAAGGLIAKSERSGGAPTAPGEPTPPASANLRLRIPPGAFDSFLARVEKVGIVLERTTSGDDVTDQVVDVGSRIASARKSLERVRALMDRATTLRDVVSLESEVAGREAELEALLARQAKLKQRSELASVTVHLVTKEQLVPSAAEQKQQGFTAGLGEGWDAFKTSATALATVLGALLPFALVLLVLSPVLLIALRRHRRPGRFGHAETV